MTNIFLTVKNEVKTVANFTIKYKIINIFWLICKNTTESKHFAAL